MLYRIFGILVQIVCIFLVTQWSNKYFGKSVKNETLDVRRQVSYWRLMFLGHFYGCWASLNVLLWVFLSEGLGLRTYYHDVKDKIEVPPESCEHGTNGLYRISSYPIEEDLRWKWRSFYRVTLSG